MTTREDAEVQGQGRSLVELMHRGLKALRIYPLENEIVQEALGKLHDFASSLVESGGGASIQVQDDFFFFNGTRLRLDMRTFAAFGSFARTIEEHGIGEIDIFPGLQIQEWAPFLSLLLREPGAEDPFFEMVDRMSRSPIQHIEILRQETEGGEDVDEVMLAAKRTYAESVHVARNVLSDVRMGAAADVRRVKRAVQNIVDQVLSDEPSMVTMTTLRDFDEYTFTHCVNVCIFSVVIGHHVGLDKHQLYELGLCGLLHDIGKQRTGWEIINKPGKPTEEEWKMLRRHPTEGLLILFQMGGFADVPYRQMLAAYEHHMRINLTGYPTNRRERRPSLFSRIVAVADAFDAATTPRSYQYKPRAPDEVLGEMLDDPYWGLDPAIVKAFVNAIGVFPIGTPVLLSGLEVAIVAGVNPETLHLPKVKVITDSMAVPIVPPPLVDLSELDPETGQPANYIIRTLDPERFGINVADYLT